SLRAGEPCGFQADGNENVSSIRDRGRGSHTGSVHKLAVMDEPRCTEAATDYGHGPLRIRAAGRRREGLQWADLQDALLAVSPGQRYLQRRLLAQWLSA